MRKLILVITTLSLSFMFAQSRYEIGYKNGYSAGCKYADSSANCNIISAPLPTLNQNRNSYQDGYQNGYQDGLRKGNSNQDYQRQPREYGEYQNIDTNTLAKLMYLRRQAEVQRSSNNDDYYERYEEIQNEKRISTSAIVREYSETNSQISDVFIELYNKYGSMELFEKTIDEFKKENEKIYNKYKKNSEKFAIKTSALRIKIIDYKIKMLYDTPSKK